jgi:sugar phosphate isomerase/epimerase
MSGASISANKQALRTSVVSQFTYCLNTSTIRPTPLLDKVRIAGRAGYEAIEPWNDEVDEYLRGGGTIGDLNRAIADAGLRVVSVIALHSWITTEGEGYTRALDECRRRMDQAAALDSPYIVASPPQEVINLDHASRRYAELLSLGRQAGVKPAMEFLGFVSGIRTMAAAWAIAAGTGDASATVVADVFHMMRGGSSVDDLLMISGSRLANFHINDVPASPPVTAQTDNDRVMVGEGIADLPRVVSHLKTIGYRGPISLELFNKDLWVQDPLEVARRGLERVRELVEG